MNLLEIFKPIEPEINEVKFLVLHNDEIGRLSLTLDTFEFSDDVFSETIDTIKDKIVETLNEFREVKIENQFDLQKNSIQVASDSRRGVVNFNFKNCYWYNGTLEMEDVPNNIDSPLAIVKRGDRYGVIKNPRFDILGFKIADLDLCNKFESDTYTTITLVDY